jgi:2-oxoglutarate dehydrogenase E2 component (dihydrolipoamide succinyltransferase)
MVSRPEPEPVDMAAFRSPAVRRLLAEHDLDFDSIQGSGRDGRLTREDVVAAVARGS